MIDECNGTNCLDLVFANGNYDNQTRAQQCLAEELLLVLQLYYTPILVILGCVGNTLSVFVFFGTKLKKLSSSYYLAALAVSDTAFLVTEFITWLNMVNVPLFKQSGFCELAVYFSHVSSFLSVWLVVLFTIERFIAVIYPLHRLIVCTVARAKLFICSLTVFALLIYSPYFVIAAPQIVTKSNRDDVNITTETCGLVLEYTGLASNLNHLDFFLSLVLPFCTIVVLNSLICRTVHRLAQTRRTMTPNSRKRFINGQRAIRHHSRRITRTYSHRSNSNSQSKVTQMLLVVSTVFICLNLPSYLLRIWVYVNEKPEEEDEVALILMQHYFNLLFATNFGINFVLYCISGQNFRKSLCTLFRLRSERRVHEHTQATVLSEYYRAAPIVNSTTRRRLTFAGSTAEVQKAMATTVITSDDHQNGADSNDHHYNHHIIVTTTAQ